MYLVATDPRLACSHLNNQVNNAGGAVYNFFVYKDIKNLKTRSNIYVSRRFQKYKLYKDRTINEEMKRTPNQIIAIGNYIYIILVSRPETRCNYCVYKDIKNIKTCINIYVSRRFRKYRL